MMKKLFSTLFILLPFCVGQRTELCEMDAPYYINNDPVVHTCNYDEGNYTCKGMEYPLLENNTTVCFDLNEQNGTLEVVFPFEPENKYEKYTVDLWNNESISTEKECQTFTRTALISYLHSREELALSTCRTENARNDTISKSMTGSIVFKYVYTGCYFVSITPAFNNGTKGSVVYTKPFTLETKYKKKFVKDIMPTVHQQCSNNSNNFTYSVSITNFALLFGEKLPIQMWLNKGGCTPNANVAAWKFSFTKGTGTLRCRKHEDYNVMPSCIQTEKESVVCTITENIEEGRYCILIDPVDRVRCQALNLWKFDRITSKQMTCYFSQNMECKAQPAPSQSEDKVPVKPDLYIYILSGFGCLFLIIASISFIILCRRYKRPFPKPIPDAQCVLHPLKYKVLLLYAQDCEPFMKLMTTFRELLSNVAECEVLDCFDPQRTEELAVNPSEWMCGWASNPNVKVVVVTSDCAVAHQKALASNGSLQYRRPVPFNDLFLLGLKEVIYNHKNEYLSTLVVRFNVTGKEFSYLTPYTRFVLPQHLEDLLKNLNPYIDTSVLNECKDGEKLQNDYKAFLHYKEQNPHYSTRLLARLQEVIRDAGIKQECKNIINVINNL